MATFYEDLHIAPNSILLIKRACFSISLVLGICLEILLRTVNLRKNGVSTNYAEEKRYCKLLVSLSILFVHILLHTREYDFSTQIVLEPVRHGHDHGCSQRLSAVKALPPPITSVYRDGGIGDTHISP